jgi:hypothetical protein
MGISEGDENKQKQENEIAYQNVQKEKKRRRNG